MARKMKDSGVEWIGMIPDGWSIHRLKSCVLERDSGAWGSDASGDEGDMVCLRIADFDYGRYKFKDVENPVRRNYDKATVERLVLKKNDLLVEKSGGGDKTPVGRMVMFDKDYPALYANFMDRLRCRDFVAPKWFLYLWNMFYSNGYVWNYIKQTTGLQNYDLASMLAGEKVALPTLIEQQRIADFLDVKCASIDDVIAKTNESIEEYKKLKQAVITEAVTVGVRGKRPMKDSGVDWIGQIPKEWNVNKMKYLGRFICGYAFPSSVFKNYGVRVMKISNIQPMQIDWSDESFVDEHYFEELPNYVVKNGTLVFALTRPIISGGIKAALVNTDEKILLNQRNAMFIGNERISYKWQYYLMLNANFIQEFEINIDKTGQQPNISSYDIENIFIPLPPLDEQQEIADYLDSKCAAIDTLISKKQQFIDELTAYKKSLIYEYVTGKKEVPA